MDLQKNNSSDQIFIKLKKILLVILVTCLINGILYAFLFFLLGHTYFGKDLIHQIILIPIIVLGWITCGIASGIWIKGGFGDKILYGILALVLSVPLIALATIFPIGWLVFGNL